jgi:hypothetical protein
MELTRRPTAGPSDKRTLLMQQARRQFSEAYAESLVLLLEMCVETETLVEVEEWITYNRGEALLAMVPRRLGRGDGVEAPPPLPSSHHTACG